MVKKYALIDIDAVDGRQLTIVEGPTYPEPVVIVPPPTASIVRDIANAMISAGWGTAFGTNIFAQDFPPTPLIAYSIFQYSGKSPEGFMGSGPPIDWSGIQIQARDTNKERASTHAEEIRQAFDDLDLSGSWVQASRSTPIELTSLDDGRAGVYRFSVDFTVAIERSV